MMLKLRIISFNSFSFAMLMDKENQATVVMQAGDKAMADWMKWHLSLTESLWGLQSPPPPPPHH